MRGKTVNSETWLKVKMKRPRTVKGMQYWLDSQAF